MGLVETVRVAMIEELDRVAEVICQEYKAAVKANLKHPENSSGQAANSIRVQAESEYVRFVGSNDDHLYFFEMGNGSGGIPKSGKPIRPMPMTYGTNGKPRGFSMHVNNYKGQNVKHDVAAKHGG